MVEQKKNKQEKKIHPFLFLVLLTVCCGLVYALWSDWLLKSKARRLDEIVQSQDIYQLITGEGYNKKNFSEELEKLKNAHKKEYDVQGDLGNVLKSFADIPDFADIAEDDVGLAMKGIEVSQGKQGMEEWRLYAVWATMRQKTGILQVEEPIMWHRAGDSSVLFNSEKDKSAMYLKDDRNKIEIRALHGLVYDNNRKVLLQRNVSAVQDTNKVEGSILSYSSAERVAFFPQRANFQGEGISGNADVLSWNMQTNKIYGTGKVYVEWQPSKQ